ncbi:type II secretion system protein [Desulfobulbus sp.]|uniref:type II secretion system protein n=1 Tax=Desulfobulbus sp. TaxID=895 RepID=UPI0027B902D0|nr:prepilin-type N-terminal cleavage/methylation domain-containing protein [Desulfobulbus sp.]
MKVFAQKMKDMLETRKQQLATKKRNNDGFTLLELLVVVAILAAIAGTATIALKDTDARASAAAHVTMMDELNKGISTFRVLQRNVLPNRFDSLMASDLGTATGIDAIPTAALGFDGATEAFPAAITADIQGIMADAGITELRYIDGTATPPDAVAGSEDCTNAHIQDLIASKRNAVVAGNIFMSEDANGCGMSVTLSGASTTDPIGLYWMGGQERLTGQPGPTGEFDGTNLATATGNAYLLTGIGPSSTLFDANTLGGMTTVPVYRHVKPNEYNRFIAVWNVGEYDGAGNIVAADQLNLTAIVDGALDTKEEELGEWDGTRNTI